MVHFTRRCPKCFGKPLLHQARLRGAEWLLALAWVWPARCHGCGCRYLTFGRGVARPALPGSVQRMSRGGAQG